MEIFASSLVMSSNSPVAEAGWVEYPIMLVVEVRELVG